MNKIAHDYAEFGNREKILCRFGEFALRSNSLDKVLTEACRLVTEALDTDFAKVMELQTDGKTLVVRAGVGWDADVMGNTIVEVTDDTFEGRALKTGEPTVSSDISKETRFTYGRFLTDNGVRAVASVVIGGHNMPPFGILQVDSERPRGFAESDTDFLRSYANLLAGAVDRHKAEANLRRSNEALEARVDERTAELMLANARLEAQADERERVEDALRQSQKMEALGQLTGGLAHDFNNLLAAISGNLELIELRLAQGRAGDVDQYMKSAMNSVSRAAALTHRLLAFARRQTLSPKPTDVNQLVASLQELFARIIGPSVRLDVRLTPSLWELLCDPNQLENVLLNLILNARDAMPDGGHLTIETANVVLPDRRGLPADSRRDNMPPGDYIMLTVRDDGAGMTPEVMARAFDPFFTTKPLGQGTGLGLSMAHGFVEQSGGQIHLATNGDQGLIVTILMPRLMVDSGSEGGDGDNDERPVILLVEDERDVRMVLAQALTDMNCIVLEADNGKSGLLVLDTAKRVDLLLTDVGLPGGMNGRQLADAARLRWPCLKILFVTGYAESSAMGSGLMEHGMEVMTKPFRLAALIERLQTMMASAA